MAEALLDIHSLIRPRLAVMDGIVAMEGNGPAAGRPRAVGLVIASADALSLDAVAAEIIGYDRGEVDTTRLGHERGLGIGRIEEIDVCGVPLNEAVVPDFKKPPRKVNSRLFKLMPNFLLRWMIDSVGTAYVEVMDDRCVLCGECVANCPAKAFKKVGDRMRADRKLCISCYCCSEVCRQRAIVMRRPFAGRALRVLTKLARGAS
jgi:Pyruvate/2-oxoacid:ferredoxin oxidoreductase delta subunit